MGNHGNHYTEEFKADIIRLVREEKRSISSIEKDFVVKDLVWIGGREKGGRLQVALVI